MEAGLEDVGRREGTGLKHIKWNESNLLKMANIRRILYSWQDMVGLCFNEFFGDH